MKTHIIIAAFLTRIAVAQIPVTDAASIANQQMNHIQNLAKQVEQIANQVEQISQLKEQVTQLQDVNSAIDLTNNTLGTYGQGGLSSLTNALNETNRYGNATTLSNLTGNLNAGGSSSYTGGGVFKPMDDAPQMSAEEMKKYAANEAAYENYKTVSDDVKSRRETLAQSKQDNLTKMANANNEADFARYKAAAEADDAEIKNLAADQQAAAADVAAQASITQSQNAKEMEMLKKKAAELEAKEVEDNRKAQQNFDSSFWDN